MAVEAVEHCGEGRADTTLGMNHEHTRLQGSPRYSCISVSDVSHSQCKTEVNPSFCLEEPDAASCKVPGSGARAGLQLSSGWQGKQTAQVQENTLQCILGLSSTEQNRQPRMCGALELQSLHQIHLSGVRIYIWLKKLRWDRC